jgi:sugar/nucleoside kinase (ribokinase family)
MDQVSNNKHDSIKTRKIQFLSVGHFTHDVVGNELILGGAAAYSSATAKKLGLLTGVVSAVGKDFLHYNKFKDTPLAIAKQSNGELSKYTTTFENIYRNGVRRQLIKGVSTTIRSEHIPDEWRDTSIVYLCPVANEIEPSVVHGFNNSIIGASPQGWMRRWDTQGHVYPKKWEDASIVLPYINALIMSEEDISPFPEVVDEYAELVEIMIITTGEKGSTLYHKGKKRDFPAYKTNVLDPTGAGDVFATAFLVKLQQTKDPYEASIFANCTASFIVEKRGTEGIPDLGQVESRLKSFMLNS